MTILITGGLSMNLGTIVLVGCVLGTGAIVYRGTMAGAAPANPATATSAVHAEATPIPHSTVVIEPTALAHAGTPPPAPSPTAPGKLTLEQVRGLARPPSTSVPVSPPFVPPVRSGGAPAPAAPTTPQSTPPVNESGQSPTATVTPQPPVTPAPTPTPEPPQIATPPPLPPVPERPAPGPLPTEEPY